MPVSHRAEPVSVSSCVCQAAQEAQLHLVDFIKEVEGRGEAGLQGKAQRKGGHCLLPAAEQAEGAVVPSVRPAVSALPSKVREGLAMHYRNGARCQICCWWRFRQKRSHDLLLYNGPC